MRRVCIPCRKSFEARSQRCSDCKSDLQLAGTAFRTPNKHDDDGWKLVSIVLAEGFLFNPGSWVPRTLAEVAGWRAERRRLQVLREQSRRYLMKYNRKKKRTTPKRAKRFMRWVRRSWKEDKAEGCP